MSIKMISLSALSMSALTADRLEITTETLDPTAPTVLSTSPANSDSGVASQREITATFNEPMDAATLTESTFTLRQGADPVPGVVRFSGNVATFDPTIHLDADAVFTATSTTQVADLSGNALEQIETWSFISSAQGPAAVDLGASMILANGAQPKNILWQASGAVAIDTTAHVEGIAPSKTDTTLATGATIDGRLLAQTAVTVDGATVTQP